MTRHSNLNRPLSPHLTIYKPQLTSLLSIMHRITGIGLILAVFLLIIWFVALCAGPRYFALMENIFNSSIVRVILISSIWALWYHTLTGIRHLIWDLGYGLDIRWVAPSAYLIVISSFCFTLITIYLSWSVS